jgi:hypothetical protein
MRHASGCEQAEQAGCDPHDRSFVSPDRPLATHHGVLDAVSGWMVSLRLGAAFEPSVEIRPHSDANPPIADLLSNQFGGFMGVQ